MESLSNVYPNDDITFFRAKMAGKLRQKAHIKTVSMQNERVVMYTDDGESLDFENICDLYKWDQCLVLSACKEHLNFWLEALLNFWNPENPTIASEETCACSI